jgi:polysaccharide deacetylase 2 family uncharacterized protein YibQ
VTSNDDQKQLSLLLSESKIDETGILWETVLHAALVLLFATIFIAGSTKVPIGPGSNPLTVSETSISTVTNDHSSIFDKTIADLNQDVPEYHEDFANNHPSQNTEERKFNQLKLSPNIDDILFSAVNESEQNAPPVSELLFSGTEHPEDAEDDLNDTFDSSNYLFKELREHTTVPEERKLEEHPVATPLPHPVVKSENELYADDVIAITATILNNLDLIPSQNELSDPKLPTVLPVWLNLRWFSMKVTYALHEAGSATVIDRYDNDKTSEFLTLSVGSTPPVKLFFKKPKAKAKVAVVVDDIGFGSSSTSDLLTIDAPLTLAVIPFCRGSVAAVTKGLMKAYELILHMPMEPKKFQNAIRKNIGVYTNQSDAQIRMRINAALDSLPAGISGVNNHMGSAFTESSEKLTPVMNILAERGLYFLDSFTSKDSCAVLTARKANIKTGIRNFEFIDNKPGVSYSVSQFNKLINYSSRKKFLITIMHDRQNSITALKKSIKSFRKAGIELTFSSEILEYSCER